MSFSITLVLAVVFIGVVHSISLDDMSDSSDSDHPSPVLIITGYTGSNLYVRDRTDTNCNTNGEEIRIWINITHMATAPECFISQMKLDYRNGHYADATNVTISTAEFGNVLSLVDLSELFPPELLQNTSESDLGEYLVERGYVVNRNIRAASYDWRLGAEQLDERGYYANLKQLIQQMYEENHNTKVTIIAISMGGPVSLHFLTQIVNQEWKDSFIHSYITLAAAWSGSNGILVSLLTPPPASLFLSYPIEATVEDLRDLTRSFASSYFLTPRASVLKDMTIITTPTDNYTANDYQKLFNDGGYPQGYSQISEMDLEEFSPPNVPTYCFYGLGFPTVESFIYDGDFPNSQPTYRFGEGDGVINKASLEVCLRWANSSYPFNRTVFPGLDHFTITNDEAILQAIGNIVGAPADPLNVCHLPVVPGPCRAAVSRYYFNSAKGVCEQFTYGGCFGNNNNFETMEECNNQCNPNGCPPLCTKEYCTAVNTRRSLCTLPTPQDECDAKCRITYCHTCYYDDIYRPLPGNCNTCSYYPTVRQATNRCFRRWAVCTRRANARQYTKARGKQQKIAQRFKCYEHPCR